MRPRPWHLPLLAALLAMLAGCATQPGPALPDPAVLAAHEWNHGPPWGPEEQPWVMPPSYYYDPYPWYWGGPAIGLGFGVGRGHWWGGHRGFGHGGWHGHGHVHGGGRGGGRGGRR